MNPVTREVDLFHAPWSRRVLTVGNLRSIILTPAFAGFRPQDVYTAFEKFRLLDVNHIRLMTVDQMRKGATE